MDSTVFMQLSVLLFITVVVAFIVRMLKQPLIVAYILAGVMAGPLFFDLLQGGTASYGLFAQVGVVLLLFVIGLNLNFRKLKSIGRVSAITALGQVLFTASIGTTLLLWMNFSLLSALYIAIAMTFSSTIIIMKFLSDKKDTETTYGKHTIGLMLVQDIIALTIMVGIGLVKSDNFNTSSIVLLILKGILAGSAIILLAKYLLPKVLKHIASSTEFLFIFTITWCFGVASALYALGFSLEIGAIAAGISLSSSPYQLEIGSRIKPLRDFFLVLFFIVLGSEMHVQDLLLVWRPGILLTLFILLGNPFILYFLFRALKFTRRNSFLSGVTAAQVSEFGFVILFTGKQAGHIAGNEVPLFTFVALATIFASSYLIMYNEQIYRFLLPVFQLFGPDKRRQGERPTAAYDAWVVGYHRIGKRVSEALRAKNIKFAVLDFDPSVIQELHHEKIPSCFGDIADSEFLSGLPLSSASLIIMTIPTVDDQLNLIAHVRAENPDIIVVANAYYMTEAEQLYEAGVDYVMMPHLLGGNWIADVLKRKVTHKSLAVLREEQGILSV
ncbi:MAG TPA: cation:proton antiporter [Candidatus Andersenbacteria bacterium]|nr:cation:proton antiporter [Candidatus Andersenbacteria bacterium]